MKVDVWRAFFNDYRNLKVGILYAKGDGPQGYSNMASDFEVVNKMHLDMAIEALKTIKWVTGYKDENDKYYPDNTCTADRNLIDRVLNFKLASGEDENK